MNPSYKKEKDNDYMILEAPGRPEGSEYQIRMLLLNSMEGILPCKMRKIDGIPEFFYDITCKQPMTRAFERRQMKKEDIEALLNGLEKALDESGRYLLDMKQFVLKPEYIFREAERGSFAFCYLPFYEGSLEEDFRELAEYILKRLDHNQEEAVLWGYDIYSRSMEENFSIGKILESARERTGREIARRAAETPEEPEIELVETEDEEEKEAECAEQIAEENARTEQSKAEKVKPEMANPEKRKPEKVSTVKVPLPEKRVGNISLKKVKKPLLPIAGILLVIGVTAWAVVSQGLNMVQAGGILFLGIGVLIYFLTVFQRRPVKREDSLEEVIEEWTIDSAEEHTVFFRKELKEKHPVLVSMEPDRQENVVLDKEVMKAGKQKEQVDIYLPDPLISRVHAGFEKEADNWYIVDCHSTNGTFLNGERLMPGERKVLKEGMEIRLATLCFYFHGTEVIEKS